MSRYNNKRRRKVNMEQIRNGIIGRLKNTKPDTLNEILVFLKAFCEGFPDHGNEEIGALMKEYDENEEVLNTFKKAIEDKTSAAFLGELDFDEKTKLRLHIEIKHGILGALEEDLSNCPEEDRELLMILCQSMEDDESNMRLDD